MAVKDDRSKPDQRIIVETYSEELTGLSRSPSMILVHKFGERQNAYNRNMETRMQAVQSVCRRFQSEINTLQNENERLKAELRVETNRNRELFERMAAEIKKMENEINMIRLSAKLNSNNIDILVAENKARKEEKSRSDDENMVKNGGNN